MSMKRVKLGSQGDASLKRLGVDHIDLYYQHRAKEAK
jgi:aryl-alcohol dehydrogenase-like predicted oxidoreductase